MFMDFLKIYLKTRQHPGLTGLLSDGRIGFKKATLSRDSHKKIEKKLNE